MSSNNSNNSLVDYRLDQFIGNKSDDYRNGEERSSKKGSECVNEEDQEEVPGAFKKRVAGNAINTSRPQKRSREDSKK